MIDEIVREGARRMLAAALEAEVAASIAAYADQSTVDYVYVWADGIHVNVRLDEEKLCLLVLIGVRVDATKQLVTLADGYRESTGSWADLLRDCTRRGARCGRRCARVLGRVA